MLNKINSRIWNPIFLLALIPGFAKAYITPLPSHLAHDVLSESVPTAFPAFEMKTTDWSLEWIGQGLESNSVQLEPQSIQWVRVADVLSLPRARVKVRFKLDSNSSGGVIQHAGFTQPLVVTKNEEDGSRIATAHLPVALFSGEGNSVSIVVSSTTSPGAEKVYRFFFKFQPASSLTDPAPRVFFDASCSKFSAAADEQLDLSDRKTWVYVGCRMVELEGEDHKASALEMSVFWDNQGQLLSIQGVPTPSSSYSLWNLRLRSEPGTVELGEGANRVILRYSMNPVYKRGFLGLGVGPYLSQFEGNGEKLDTVSPILTLYGSYFITEQMRVVGFGAVTLDPHATTDVGVYAHSEYLRVIDRRLAVSLLLGAHVLGFRSQGVYRLKPGAPQGAEVIFFDFGKKGHHLVGGLFLYPPIDGKAYYNFWLRWGSARLFGEINYIGWKEEVDGLGVDSRSVGVSIGFPVARFL